VEAALQEQCWKNPLIRNPIFTCMILISIGHRENSEVLFEPTFTLLAHVSAIFGLLTILTRYIGKWPFNEPMKSLILIGCWLVLGSNSANYKARKTASINDLLHISICFWCCQSFHYLHDW
jgi:hypothetical protein